MVKTNQNPEMTIVDFRPCQHSKKGSNILKYGKIILSNVDLIKVENEFFSLT